MGADEARTVSDLKGHQAAVLPMVGEFGGRIIDTAGDGILAEFPSVVNAVKCAVAIQSKMAERNTTIEQERRMQFRIGINIGDVVYDETRIYGDGINVAARLEGIAEAGGICVSGKVYDEISGRIDLAFQDIGEQQLKNIARPVKVYRVQLGKTGTRVEKRRLTAILAADVAGYSRLVGNDEDGTLAQWKAHWKALIGPSIKKFHGRTVRVIGDGLLVEFASVVDAVRCAVEVQRGMAARNADVPHDKRIEFRMGINFGELIIDGSDFWGDAVNIAARLEALADPGGICASRSVIGDGLLVEFASVVDAVRCAVEVQRGMAARNADVPHDKRIEFRMGINFGELIIDGSDFWGDAVNIAARLEALADPGGICAS